MFRDTRGSRLPWFAYCRACGVRHLNPHFLCLGFTAPRTLVPSAAGQWYYRGSDENLYVSTCRDCELRLGFDEVVQVFAAELQELVDRYRARGGHLELDASELVPPLTLGPVARDIPPPPLPRVHRLVAERYPRERELSPVFSSASSSSSHHSDGGGVSREGRGDAAH